ncbi:MAG: phosphonate ABC transporter substrate-binding protein [Moraxellaceae bacterium]|nr:MAG: phosphonate ABC transporter substrate-binding protein [Moraxellaceae bacterium]
MIATKIISKFNKDISLLIAVVFLTFPLLSFNSYADIELKFGIYTSDKPTTMVKMFRPILNVIEASLSEKLSTPTRITLQVASDYKKGIENLVNGRVDFSRMGPASYILSQQKNEGIRLIAMESKNGKKHFWGIVCVNESSPINTIDQITGRSFAFGNKRSTIGRYLSQALLREHGITSNKLSRFDYLSRHDRVATAVGANQFDAGALKESTFNKMKNQGVPIREIARFKNVTKPWIASSSMDNVTFKALQETLLEMKDTEALKTINKSGFLPSTKNDYAIIWESMANNSDFFIASE